MKRAIREKTQETADDDFSLNMFLLMQYDDPGFTVESGVDLPFVMCREKRNAQTDVCVVNKKQIFLIVQEDKQCVGAGIQKQSLWQRLSPPSTRTTFAGLRVNCH
jgi:hypothetical protein